MPPVSATLGEPHPTQPGQGTAEDAIRVAVKAAAGLGVPGIFIPTLDEGGMAAIWLTMVTTIARRSGATLSPAAAGKFVTSALSGVMGYQLGSRILTWAVMSPLVIAFPVGGIPAAAAINAGLNALFTYRLGKECVRRFATANFTAADTRALGRALVGLPSVQEINDLRRLVTG